MGGTAQVTPPGEIRTADPLPPPSDENSRQRATRIMPGAGPKPAPPSSIEYHVLPPFDGAPIEARFAKAYARARSPSIAVFFNRTLSDEVREWTAPPSTATATHEVRVVGPGGVGTDRTQETTTIPATTRQVEERRAIAERMAWQVETAFSQPMLVQHVKLVDRATILRLVALASGKQGDPNAVFSVKQVEMAALVGHADYFVELLVSSSSDSPLGYDLKATVKAVATGQIMANLTTATWNFTSPPKAPAPTRKAVATDKGYVYVDVPAPPVRAVYPSTTEVASRLADQALGQLADALERLP